MLKVNAAINRCLDKAHKRYMANYWNGFDRFFKLVSWFLMCTLFIGVAIKAKSESAQWAGVCLFVLWIIAVGSSLVEALNHTTRFAESLKFSILWKLLLAAAGLAAIVGLTSDAFFKFAFDLVTALTTK